MFRLVSAMFVFAGLVLAGQLPGDLGRAKEINRSNVWINSSPLSLKSLKGKVVFIDFWAFDCPPCIETMPHVVDLYEKYSKEGLVVIGVHTPRLEYEKDISRLREAIARMGIKFPVEVDNKETLFRDYLCDLWPTQFIIDRKGIVRYIHGGVGRYDDMEKVVQDLLKVE